jgi:hypothetical protein
MWKRIRIIVLALLVIGISLATGIYIGSSRTIKFVYNDSLSSAELGISTNIHTLEMLRKGETEKAEELLESLIDVQVGHLGVSTNSSLLGDKAKVLEAIRLAKEYRAKYPGHKVNPTLNNSVVNAFKLVEK